MIVKTKFHDDFECIAAACPDTCCAGWEIDVDADTLDYYNSIEGDDGEFVRSRVFDADGGAVLCREGERCQFLRGDNLCELILRLGECALCDICREHPRFYSGSENITEVGIGLCCPEAARLWLASQCELILEDDGYSPDANERKTLESQIHIIDHIQNGEGTLGERLYALLGGDEEDDELYGKLCTLYTSLELLDESFPKRFSLGIPSVSDVRYARLAAYFIYRYYFELGEELCLSFAAASVIMIAAMGEDVARAAKDYSKEVEYDTDNLDKIYAFLGRCRGLGSLCKEIFR